MPLAASLKEVVWLAENHLAIFPDTPPLSLFLSLCLPTLPYPFTVEMGANSPEARSPNPCPFWFSLTSLCLHAKVATNSFSLATGGTILWQGTKLGRLEGATGKPHISGISVPFRRRGF